MTRAFTLIELMIVIAIVAIIAAIALAHLAERKAEADAPRARVSASGEIDGMPFGVRAAVVTLPTGERVMVLSRTHGTTADGLAAVALGKTEVKP
jgi:prepilin-type N-terminal cleavage/methylation domain-containing protein